MAKRRMNGEGTWTERPNGTWKLSVSYKGVGRKYFYGDKQTCLKKKNEFEALLDKGLVGEKDILFKDFAKAWLKNVKMPTVKPTTYDNLERMVNNHLIKQFGDLELKQIDGYIIQTFLINKMKADGFAHGTIKQNYSTLGSILKYATLRGKIDKNPIAEVALPKKELFNKKETRYLSKDERDALIATCNLKYKTGRFYFKNGPFYIFLMYTGCRIGEAVALKWSDIDFENRTATIGRTMVLYKERTGKNVKTVFKDQSTTKTGRTRKIYLSDMAINALMDLKSSSTYEPNGYILPGKIKDKPVRILTTQKSFNKIVKRAGIASCSVHSLRHTFVSLMVHNNIPIPMIAQMVGHSNIGTTMKTYTHLLKETQHEAMSIIKDIK